MTVLAHARGVTVEAELGRLAGEEDGLSVSEKEAKMTDPTVVTRFLSETHVDMLAVTIPFVLRVAGFSYYTSLLYHFVYSFHLK